MRFRKIYLEITNLCNRSCSFCPGTSRPPRSLSLAELEALLPKLRPYTDFLYFHLMGEPLFHPELEAFALRAADYGFRLILTTNGTLLPEKLPALLRMPALHKVNVSLHSFEANDTGASKEEYLEGCVALGRIPFQSSETSEMSPESHRSFIVCYRLWNEGGADCLNSDIEKTLRCAFPGEWHRDRSGIRLAERTYLQYGEKFDWPDEAAEDGGPVGFCYGLRDQLGVLSDGTVVPCCLDNNGTLALGNLFTQSMEEILDSPRAKAIYAGFSERKAVESLCRRCGYARRFH